MSSASLFGLRTVRFLFQVSSEFRLILMAIKCHVYFRRSVVICRYTISRRNCVFSIESRISRRCTELPILQGDGAPPPPLPVASTRHHLRTPHPGQTSRSAPGHGLVQWRCPTRRLYSSVPACLRDRRLPTEYSHGTPSCGEEAQFHDRSVFA